jgi:hypothetical protein
VTAKPSIDRLTATLLIGLARHVDFVTACLVLATGLAELGDQGCPIEARFSWHDPIHRAWILAAAQEPTGYLLN